MYISIEELIEAGVHFGHQTKYWNPKMRPFIYGIKNKIHIINLDITAIMLEKSLLKLKNIIDNKGKILFVGTKMQAREIIKNTANKCNQFYINYKWLGGTLTNWKIIKKSIKKLKELEIKLESDFFKKLTKKESLIYLKKLKKLNNILEGIKNMNNLPNAIFVIDSNKEHLAIKESNKMNIPVFSIVDTNSNPDNINYIIPGNDDSIKSINLYLYLINKILIVND